MLNHNFIMLIIKIKFTLIYLVVFKISLSDKFKKFTEIPNSFLVFQIFLEIKHYKIFPCVLLNIIRRAIVRFGTSSL